MQACINMKVIIFINNQVLEHYNPNPIHSIFVKIIILTISSGDMYVEI